MAMDNPMRFGQNTKEQQIIAKLENDARNELHSIMGMLELVARGPLTRAQSDYLRFCKSSTDRLLRSVQNAAILFKQDTDASQVNLFSLHDVVRDVTNLMEVLARRKGLSLRCQIESDTPNRVIGDRDRLQDILVRLLENAVRFTHHGYIRLTGSGVEEKPRGCRVQFDICDTGPGIPLEVVSSLSDETPVRIADRGLGLPIVRKLVLSMNGELTFGRQEPAGSLVRVTLPFVTATEEHPTRESVAHGNAAPLSILVAEDSDDSYYVLEFQLLREGHRLTRAVSGTRALELFKAGNFDLVLMDVHMPEMDGYSATRAIRVWETGCARARVPIVVLSSDSPATQLQHGAKVGCSAYLTKPVSSEALRAVLRRYAREDK